MASEGTARVVAWWLGLSLVSVANVAIWVTAVRQLSRQRHANARPPQSANSSGNDAGAAERFQKWQVLLSLLFVLGCAFRSLLPRAEASRMCLIDWPIANAVLGRAVATVAELALMAQFTLVLRFLARGARSRLARIVSWILLPQIVCAEVFSWYSALTTNYLGSVIEESIWAFSALLMTASFIVLWPRHRDPQRRFIGTSIALGIAYIAFMCAVDVPMYWSRWRSAEAQGQGEHQTEHGGRYFSVSAGWHDAWNRRVVTRRWEDWRQEIPWMSLYFTLGVWISIALIQTPLTTPAGPALPRRAA